MRHEFILLLSILQNLHVPGPWLLVYLNSEIKRQLQNSLQYPHNNMTYGNPSTFAKLILSVQRRIVHYYEFYLKMFAQCSFANFCASTHALYVTLSASLLRSIDNTSRV